MFADARLNLRHTMPIEFVCSNAECRKTLEVADDLAGKKVRCPKCRTVMVVPRADPGSDASDSTGYEATMALEEELVKESPHRTSLAPA